MEVYCHGHYPGRIDHLVDHCRVHRHLSGCRRLALAHYWRAIPEWCAISHFHPGCGGLSAYMERFRVSSRVWLLCSLLPAWRLRRSASSSLPLVLSATDHAMACETC